MPNFTPSVPERPVPWTFWPTLGFSFLILVGFSLGGFVVSLVYLRWELSHNPALINSSSQAEFLTTLDQNGTFLAWNTLVSGVVGLGAIALAIRLKKGWTCRDYLNFKQPQWSALLIWNALLVVLMVMAGQIAQFFNRKSDFMENIFASEQTNLLLLAIAVVVMAPLFEEVFFRGFMFKGLEKSRVGMIGTIVVTSFIWAIIHIQYEPFFIGVLFVLGLLLGYARHVTQSLWIPISMHALNNGLAMLGAYAWMHSIVFT